MSTDLESLLEGPSDLPIGVAMIPGKRQTQSHSSLLCIVQTKQTKFHNVVLLSLILRFSEYGLVHAV